MYYSYSSNYPIKAQASCCENPYFPPRRVYSKIATLTLCTLIVIYLALSFTSDQKINYIEDELAKLRIYASKQYTSFRTCDRCSIFNISFAITNQDYCSTAEDIYLLIIVLSHPSHLEQRMAIRRTWGSVSEHRGQSIKTLFLLGLSDAGVPNGPYIDTKVEAEYHKHGDIVVLNMTDHYTWLTNKSMAGLNWASSYCKIAKYILKTDDDCFNNPAQYVTFLTSTWLPKHFIGGCCFTAFPTRDKNSKWYTDPKDFPDMYFPIYCGGPAYLLSQGAIKKILSASQNVPYFTMEDIYITGFCREAAQVPYIQIAGVNAPRDTVTDCDLALWVTHVHRVNAEDMHTMWMAANDGINCHSPNTVFVTVICILLFFTFWAYLLSKLQSGANKIHVKI